MAFFKSKKFWIPLVLVVAVVSYVGYGQYKNKNAAPQYETVKVSRGDLVQTVEATGKIQSADDLSLRFETPGTLARVNVKEGDKVKAGDALANLKAADLEAAVAQARATLDQKIAGANKPERAYYQAAVEAASADLEKTKADTANAVAAAESAADTAKNNLKLAEGGESSQIVSQVYEDTVAMLQTSLAKLDDGLTQADNILGIDNPLANDSFQDYLSLLDNSKLVVANSAYNKTKPAKVATRGLVTPLTTLSAHSDIDQAVNSIIDTLSMENQLLLKVADVLTATPPMGSLTQSSLDAKKTTIETTRAGITAQYTSIISQRQAIADAKNSYNTYTIAYNKAINDLSNARAAAVSLTSMKEAAYNQAVANLNSRTEPVREVDLAPLRAALSQAVANRDKAYLRAPIDGVVTKVNKKPGEFISAADVAIQMLSPNYEIDVDIPETDVAKMKLGDEAVITLDAFGDDVKFSGKIISIEPASTEIQDVVYYKVKVSLSESGQMVRPGMTANVTVKTADRQNALYIPSRAVRTNDQKYVRVLEGGLVKEYPVTLGLKADDGKTEVLGGLTEGQDVIIGTITGK